METSPEFLSRLLDLDPELVEGGTSAFGDDAFEDGPDDGGEDDEENLDG